MVTRWDPFVGALSLRDAMNRLFEQAVLQPDGEGSQTPSGAGTFAPALDVQESADAYTIRVSLPGVRPEDVNIQYQQGALSISGSTYEESSRESGTYHIRERRGGRFARTLTLPDTVDAERAEAKFEHGVLELRMPKAEATKPRRIQIQGARASELKAGGASENGSEASARTKGSKA
jgi:HSP20 family protein